MFAVFTRVAWIVLQPSSLIVGALIVSLFLLQRNAILAARLWLAAAIMAIFILGLTSLSDALILPLENRFARPDISNTRIDGIIVLGGGEDSRIAAARDVIAVNEAAGRLIEAAALARRFPTARLIFTGGGEVLSSATQPEALAARRLFLALGVPEAQLTLEDRSRTTWENAKFTAPLITQKPGERWLLVTSGWQMPRAMGAFRKVGVDVVAYPVDYRTTGEAPLFQLKGNVTDGLRRFDTILREYPALLIYWLSGRSTELFPGP